MRSKLFGFYRNIMKIFYIILITSILGSCVQNGINQSEIGYANLTIIISEMSRNWTISSYEITVGTTVSEYQSAPGGVINLRLQIGTHNIEIKAKNSAGQIVYRGKATVVLTEEGTTVQIPLLQEVGACNVTAAKSVDYSIATGQPGAIVKYVITASSPGFAGVVKETATIGDSALFTDMFAGAWSFKIEGKANALNADYTVKPNEWTTYISGTLPKTIPVNVMETLTLPATKQDRVTPVIASVQSGTINSGTAVTLSCATAGSKVKYKLGSDATADYSTAITINSTTTLRVYATKSGLTDSIIGIYTYTVDASKTASPQFSVLGGTYTSAVSLTLTAESGASIYYTDDGTAPTTSSTLYGGSPIVISSGTKTIKAIAKHPDKTASDVVAHTYTIQQLKVVTPVITPSSGSYDTNKDIVITCGTGGAAIYYTTDGTTPTASSTPYSAAFKLPVGVYSVKAFAKLNGYTDSDVVTANLTITEPVNGIKLHYKRPTDWGTTLKLHYWNLVPSAAQSTWPGVAMTAEGNDWYGYTLVNTTSSSVIFTDKNEGNKQTGDLTRTSGEWWYKNGVWTDYNPEGPTKPVITATPASGTYLTAQSVSFIGNNISGDIIYYNMTTNGADPAEPTSASLVYSSPINVPLNATYKFKVKGFNEGAAAQWGDTVSLTYTINPEADLEAPTITASKTPGKYYPNVTVSFTIKDNKSATTTAYWTTDGSEPTTSSPVYVTGNCSTGKTGIDTYVSETKVFKFLIVDGAGNQTKKTLFYNIGEGNDFREETIYFLLPTRFYDGDPTTNVHCWDDAQAKNPDSDPAWRGDFKGLIEKLDYIKALGFSAIWITPPVKNCSGYDYHGYHAINFKEIDPRYKTSDVASAEEAYQNFIAAAHAKGIKVIQDIVFNHSSNFGEENLYPLFKRNAPLGLNDTIASVEKYDPYNRLPENYDSLLPGAQYSARINAMKEDSVDTERIYHHEKSLSWESYTVQTGQIAGDCVDLNTENPVVSQYLREAFIQYIQWGVDAFRVDTVKHISRLTFNNEFIPQLIEAGGEYFYIFGETCTRYRSVWNSGIPAISVPFYTWKESVSYPWATMSDREASVAQHWTDHASVGAEPTSNNHYLNGNDYHTPDWTMRNRFDQIDFPMHWSFNNVGDAFNMALGGDQYYSDATWNVTYVDSHDYAPDGAPENQRYAGSWPEKLTLIFTFRGIPCIFYGTEIEFQKGKVIDVGPNAMLSNTGRAYFGDHIEGSVTATDFGVYTASGTVSTTLNHDLAKHITRLNRIRRAVPALQKGQYSTEGVSGDIAFKRRYTNASEGVDSFALVTINGGATFSGIPNGTYKDCVTGDTKIVSSGSLTANCSGNGNARIYVLDGPGKIGDAGAFLK